MLKAETTLYRRERRETPDGKRLTAPLDGGRSMEESSAAAARTCIASC